MRHLAFLRAINVGGRTVKMDRLRGLFTGLGLRDVTTPIASGNVLFSPGRQRTATLERRIEEALADALGFEVTTFVRTAADLATLVRAGALSAKPEETLLVGFLKAIPDDAAVSRVHALRSHADDLAIADQHAKLASPGIDVEIMVEAAI